MNRAVSLVIMVLAARWVVAAEVVQLTPEQGRRAGIETAAAREERFSNRLRTVGQVVRSPGSTLNLKTIAGGRVESLLTAPGERVRAGDPVVLLHSHELLTLQSQLLLAVDRVAQFEQQVAAGRELMSFDGISRIEMRRREQELLSARLQADTLREELLDHGIPPASLDQVIRRQSLDPHLPVISPVDGVVLEVKVQEQEWVQPYEPLLVVGDASRVELELQVSPDRASAVVEGDRVEFEPVGGEGARGTATVITRVPQIDPATRTIRIRARIDSGAEIFPGAFVEATVIHGQPRSALAVPRSAVISVGGRDSVFVVLGEGRYEAREVVLGTADPERYEVLGGLREGETVAVGGVFFLKSALVKGDGEEG